MLAATQAGLSSHGHGWAAGKLPFCPPPGLLGSPPPRHRLLSQLYKLPLFSLLFPPLQSWLSEHGKPGRHAKRCGIFFFYIVLGTHNKPSRGTVAFSSRLACSPSPTRASPPVRKAQIFSSLSLFSLVCSHLPGV